MKDNAIAQAIIDTLISPNICDSNCEAANVVDVLASIGRSIRGADQSLDRIADAIFALADAVKNRG